MRLYSTLLFVAFFSVACTSNGKHWKISSTTQATTAPAISTAHALEAPLQSHIAFAAEGDFVISTDNTNYLLLWPDLRTTAFTPIWGTRIAPSNGATLNMTGFNATPPTSAGKIVATAYNGTSHLVVWGGDVDSPTGPGILFSRLDVSGTPIDTQPQLLQASGAVGGRISVASDNDGWFAVWDDSRSGVEHIYGGRISSAGTLLDPEGFLISAGGATKEIQPTVAYGGGVYMVAWSDFRDAGTVDADIYAARVLADGTVQDPGGVLISNDTDANEPTLAYDGANFMLAWASGTIQATRLTNAATRVDVNDISIPNPAVFGSCEAPQLVFDGTQYLVGWTIREPQAQFCFANRLSTTGAVLGGITQALSEKILTTDRINCRFGSTGGNFLVGWSKSNATNYPIHTRRISSTGQTLDNAAQAPSRSANFQSSPTGAYGAGIYLVSWQEYRHAEISDKMLDSVYATRLDGSATILDSSAVKLPADHSSPMGIIGRSVAFDGSNFLVVWADTDVVDAIWGARVSPQGTILDASAFKIANDAGGSQSSPPTVAFAGGNYLVVWADSSNPNSDLVGVRVSPAGAVLNATPFPITTVAGVQSRPSIATTTDQFLVSWIDARNGSNETFARRISGQGVLLDAAELNLGLASATEVENGFPLATPPAVAADDTQYLVAWSAPLGPNHNVVARRVGTDGTTPDTSPIDIWEAGDLSVDVLATYDGASFVIAWTEFTGPAQLTYAPDKISMLAARLNPDGGIINPIPVVVADESNTVIARDLVSDRQGTVIALYSSFNSSPLVNTLRGYARKISWPDVGQACASAADCPTFGFCVDGVCCYTECGNSDTTDCQACSVAAGAAEDGLCNLLIAGTVCRPAAGNCDVQEHCSGSSTACAADELQVDGVSCDDGDACTQTDTCLAGLCLGANPVSCSAEECKLTGDCDTVTGACVPVAGGTPCDDNNACTENDTCQQGTCVSGNAVDCTPGECEFSSVCNNNSGLCDVVKLVDGASCSGGVCVNGLCVPKSIDGGVAEPDLAVEMDAAPADTVAPPIADASVDSTTEEPPPPLPEGCSCRLDSRRNDSVTGLFSLFFFLGLWAFARRKR